MNTITQKYQIWILLWLGLWTRLVVMFALGNAFYEPFLDWVTLASDLGIGYMLYAISTKAAVSKQLPPPVMVHLNIVSSPLILAALWVFNPAVIFASTAGGFHEPVVVLAVVVVLYHIRRKAYCVPIAVMLPMVLQVRFWLQGTRYASASAFNFFALVGGFEQPSDALFWGFRYSTYGVLFMAVIMFFAFTALKADRESGYKNYYLITGGYFALMFMFAHNMRFNLLLPVPVLMLLHYIDGHVTDERGQTHLKAYGLYLLFSLALFANMYMMLTRVNPPYYGHMSDGMLLASVANGLFVLVMVYVLVNAVWPGLKFFKSPDDLSPRQGIPVRYYIGILLAAGFIVRVMAIVHVDYMFGFDVWVFKSWADALYEYGFANFYGSLDVMTDYPPVYLYVLYVIGGLAARFDWEQFSTVYTFVIFLPAILCDLGIGYVLYRRAKATQRPYSRVGLPVVLAAFWILSPAVILISGVWGQVESVFSLILLLSLLLLRDRKLLPAYLLYGVAILTKPQSLFLGPVYLYSAIEYLQEERFSFISFGRLANYILAPVVMMLLMFVPFGFRTGIEFFFDGLVARPYGTINAFNFFWLIGGNWTPLDTRFMGLTYGFIGMAVVITVIVGTMAALYVDRRRGGRHYFLIVGALFALIYVFAFRMLERYFFPALPFLLLHAIERRDRRVMALYVGFSATFYFNCFEMLRWVRFNEVRAYASRSVAAGAVVLGCILVYVLVESVWGKTNAGFIGIDKGL